jgi:hypothetical protein
MYMTINPNEVYYVSAFIKPNWLLKAPFNFIREQAIDMHFEMFNAKLVSNKDIIYCNKIYRWPKLLQAFILNDLRDEDILNCIHNINSKINNHNTTLYAKIQDDSNTPFYLIAIFKTPISYNDYNLHNMDIKFRILVDLLN